MVVSWVFRARSIYYVKSENVLTTRQMPVRLLAVVEKRLIFRPDFIYRFLFIFKVCHFYFVEFPRLNEPVTRRWDFFIWAIFVGEIIWGLTTFWFVVVHDWRTGQIVATTQRKPNQAFISLNDN